MLLTAAEDVVVVDPREKPVDVGTALVTAGGAEVVRNRDGPVEVCALAVVAKVGAVVEVGPKLKAGTVVVGFVAGGAPNPSPVLAAAVVVAAAEPVVVDPN